MGFNPTKTKVQLKLALNRLQLLQQKKTALSQNTRREIGQLLKQSKFESARVRVEHVIREDFLVEALELLQLYVDTLLARFGLVTTLSYRILIRELDAGIAEAVTVLVYAAPRVDIQELSIIREQLIQKYGKDLVEKTTTFAKDHVNPRILHKLSITTPDPKLVNQYLKTIAQAYDVPWEEQVIEPVVIEPIVQPETLSFSAPVKVQEPSAPQIVDKEPDFDHLSKRFEILKQKK